MKSILISLFLPFLLALNSQPVLYCPSCPILRSLGISTYSYSTSLTILPSSELQLVNSNQPTHLTLYQHRSLFSAGYIQQINLQYVRFNTRTPRTSQICIQEQENVQILHYSLPEFIEIDSEFGLVGVENDVNYINLEIETAWELKDIELVSTQHQEMCENSIKGKYLTVDSTQNYGVCDRKVEPINVFIGTCLVFVVGIWVIIDRNKCLVEKDTEDTETFIQKLAVRVEKLDESVQKIIKQSSYAYCDSLEDIDRILLKVDTFIHSSQSFKDQIHSTIHEISYQASFPNSPSLKISCSSPKPSESLPNTLMTSKESELNAVNIELNYPKCHINTADIGELQVSPVFKKEETSDLNESFGSYEDLADSGEEVSESSLDFNSRVSREYDLARSLWKRSKKPGFMVNDA